MKLLTGPGCSSFHLVGLRCSNIISVVCADCARYPRGVCAMSSSAETTTSPERVLPKEFSRFRGVFSLGVCAPGGGAPRRRCPRGGGGGGGGLIADHNPRPAVSGSERPGSRWAKRPHQRR